MKTVTVTIGRNVGVEDRLESGEWFEFVGRVRRVVDEHAELWAVAPYAGEWSGVREDAEIFYGPVRDGWDLRKLRSELANLATYYKQDAIGLSVGESELVESWQDEGVRTTA